MTGVTGFLAPFVATRFFRHGDQILFLVRKKSGQENNLRQLILERLKATDPDYRDEWSRQWEIIIGDITLPHYGIPEQEFRQLKEKITDLFHAAALLSFKDKYRSHARATNIEGVCNTLEVAERLGTTLHYISTAYVAGMRKGIIQEDELDKGQSFNNVYEATKFEGEKLVRAWGSRPGNKVIIYRPSIIIGDTKTGVAFSFSGYYVMAKFVKDFSLWLKQHSWAKLLCLPIPIVRNAKLNLIPVNMVADLVDAITRRAESIDGTFHIVNTDPPSVQFIFEEGMKLLGISYVRFIPVSLGTLRICTHLTRAISYLFGRRGKSFRNQILTFVPYFEGDAKFQTPNTERIVGSLSVPPLNRSYFQKILEYAINHEFQDRI